MRSRSRCHALAFRPHFMRAGAFTILLFIAMSTTGCFGTFPLTRKVYQVNQDAADVEFHQTLAYWAMILTLVYPGALITDVIVMNTIEFWSTEPTTWQATGAFMPVPADQHVPMNATLPEPPAPAEAPAQSAGPVFETPVAPAVAPPSADLPGRPSVPLPLPPLAPVFEDSAAPAAGRTLSQVWDSPAAP